MVPKSSSTLLNSENQSCNHHHSVWTTELQDRGPQKTLISATAKNLMVCKAALVFSTSKWIKWGMRGRILLKNKSLKNRCLLAMDTKSRANFLCKGANERLVIVAIRSAWSCIVSALLLGNTVSLGFATVKIVLTMFRAKKCVSKQWHQHLIEHQMHSDLRSTLQPPAKRGPQKSNKTFNRRKSLKLNELRKSMTYDCKIPAWMKHNKNSIQRVVLAKNLRAWRSTVNVFRQVFFAQAIVSAAIAKIMKSQSRGKRW